jgi:hypothetical protein
MNNQIEWFCYHAIDEGWLTAEQCQLIADAFEEQGVKEDLDVFVQTVIDNEFCTDVARLNELAELSAIEARTLGTPTEDLVDSQADPVPEPGSRGRSQREDTATAAPHPPHCPVSESGPTAQRTCPFCAEPIQMAAIRCKHCGADVETTVLLKCHKCRREFTIPKSQYGSALRTHTLFSCPHCKASFVLKGSPAKDEKSAEAPAPRRGTSSLGVAPRGISADGFAPPEHASSPANPSREPTESHALAHCFGLTPPHVGAFRRKYRCPKCEAVSAASVDDGLVEVGLQCPQCGSDLWVIFPGVPMGTAVLAGMTMASHMSYEQSQGLTKVTCSACGRGVPADAEVCFHCGEEAPAALAVMRRMWEESDPVDAMTMSEAGAFYRKEAELAKRQSVESAWRAAAAFVGMLLLGAACWGIYPVGAGLFLFPAIGAVVCFSSFAGLAAVPQEMREYRQKCLKWLENNESHSQSLGTVAQPKAAEQKRPGGYFTTAIKVGVRAGVGFGGIMTLFFIFMSSVLDGDFLSLEAALGIFLLLGGGFGAIFGCVMALDPAVRIKLGSNRRQK